MKKLHEFLEKVSGTAVAFDSVNPMFKSRYASLGAVLSHLKGFPLPEGCGYTIMIEGNPPRVMLEWIEDGTPYPLGSIALPNDQRKGTSKIQALGSEITYARRYLLVTAFNLYADEDTDGTGPAVVEKANPVPSVKKGSPARAKEPAAPVPDRGLSFDSLDGVVIPEYFKAPQHALNALDMSSPELILHGSSPARIGFWLEQYAIHRAEGNKAVDSAVYADRQTQNKIDEVYKGA